MGAAVEFSGAHGASSVIFAETCGSVEFFREYQPGVFKHSNDSKAGAIYRGRKSERGRRELARWYTRTRRGARTAEDALENQICGKIFGFYRPRNRMGVGTNGTFG